MIVYYPQHNPEGIRLAGTMAAAGGTVVSCHDPVALANHLRHPRHRHRIVLIYADDRRQLQDLNDCSLLLDGLKRIIVLAEQNEKTMHEVCRLLPSYVTSSSESFADVLAVLERLRSQLHYR